MFRGKHQNWSEDTQLAMIAQDHDLLNSFQTLNYINIALLTILLYDHCLTFNLERRRIWTLSWKVPKFLFMFNRYILPPLFLFEGFSNSIYVGQKICDARLFTPIPIAVAIMTVEFMLILRVLALYGNSLGLARYFVLQFFVQIIASCLISGFLLSQARSIDGHNIFTGCVYDLPNWAPLTWTPLLVIESILIILTLYKCRNYGQFSPTIKILARDSAIYFSSLFGIILFNILYGYKHKLIGMTLTLPTAVFTSIAASRLSMNIRAITVERGIATLVHQSPLPTLLSFSGRGRNPDSTGAEGIGASSVDGVLSSTAEHEEELEGGYYDDEDDTWYQEREEDEDESEIKEEDRSIIRNITNVNDVERAIT